MWRQEDRAVSTADGAEWARSKGMLFLESSAKTERCVQQVFTEVVQKVRARLSLAVHVQCRHTAI